MGLTNAKYAIEQFLELFDTDLVTLPSDLPDFFIEQEKMVCLLYMFDDNNCC
jgi:hypothetical protein